MWDNRKEKNSLGPHYTQLYPNTEFRPNIHYWSSLSWLQWFRCCMGLVPKGLASNWRYAEMFQVSKITRELMANSSFSITPSIIATSYVARYMRMHLQQCSNWRLNSSVDCSTFVGTIWLIFHVLSIQSSVVSNHCEHSNVDKLSYTIIPIISTLQAS